MGTLQLRPEFFDVYLELAVDFGLPLRMGSSGGERLVGFPYRDLAAAEGVVFPDHLVLAPVGGRHAIERALFDLRPGVTEVYLHPAVDTDELRASHPDWAGRVEDHAFLLRRPVVPRPGRPGRGDPRRLPGAARPPTLPGVTPLALGVDVAARRGCDVVALDASLVARPVGRVHTGDELRALIRRPRAGGDRDRRAAGVGPRRPPGL